MTRIVLTDIVFFFTAFRIILTREVLVRGIMLQQNCSLKV